MEPADGVPASHDGVREDDVAPQARHTAAKRSSSVVGDGRHSSRHHRTLAARFHASHNAKPTTLIVLERALLEIAARTADTRNASADTSR
jgi:hypothetical protein